MKYIFVLQRGWVVVGDLTQSNNKCTLTNAAIIRRWGTEHGLGQLAQEGALKDTVLDAVPTGIEFDIRTSILQIPCNPKNW